MADNVAITPGTGATVAADDIAGVLHQRVKLGLGADGTAVDAVGGTGVDSTGVQRVSLATNVALPAGTNNIGDVDVLTVPADPFGVNADAASATGSVSAKLRAIATALGVTAFDLGTGTGGSRTLRFFKDTAQWIGGTGVDTSAVQRVSLATNVALPAGTNEIGKLAAGTANIGDVDVLTLPALVAGTAAIGKVKVTNDAGTVVDPVAAVGGGIPVVSGGYEYETVAASQTAQALGATGATGDYISGILVVPATTSPGVVTLLDNATSIPVFVGGATSVSNLVPFFIPLGLISVSGAWKITTGANVSCIGCGNFT